MIDMSTTCQCCGAIQKIVPWEININQRGMINSHGFITSTLHSKSSSPTTNNRYSTHGQSRPLKTYQNSTAKCLSNKRWLIGLLFSAFGLRVHSAAVPSEKNPDGSLKLDAVDPTVIDMSPSSGSDSDSSGISTPLVVVLILGLLLLLSSVPLFLLYRRRRNRQRRLLTDPGYIASNLLTQNPDSRLGGLDRSITIRKSVYLSSMLSDRKSGLSSYSGSGFSSPSSRPGEKGAWSPAYNSPSVEMQLRGGLGGVSPGYGEYGYLSSGPGPIYPNPVYNPESPRGWNYEQRTGDSKRGVVGIEDELDGRREGIAVEMYAGPQGSRVSIADSTMSVGPAVPVVEEATVVRFKPAVNRV